VGHQFEYLRELQMISHRKHYLLAVLSAVLLLSSPAPAQTNPRDTLRLDRAQFKATHNSYLLKHTPQQQIDDFDVWEIELDFGMVEDSRDFLVGHDDPDPKHGLKTLGDWVRNAASAAGLKKHPLILKLEAKTTGRCASSRFLTFTCVENWPADWQLRLVDSLEIWLGAENWITYRKFSGHLQSHWPTVAELAGKFIVTLQDSNEDLDIDKSSTFFFRREIPGLQSAWPPIKDADDFRTALESGTNRLTMDEAYTAVGSGRPLSE